MDFEFLSKTPLFHGASPDEVSSMLNCLGAEKRSYGKGEVIYRAGSPAETMGLVLSGSVSIQSDDVWGNRSILGSAEPGDVFGETYACVPGETMMVNAVAVEKSEVLLLNAAKLLKTCPQACQHHVALIRNLLTISAQKNLGLSRRIFNTSSKTIRGRLLSYLSYQARRKGSCDFEIPFDRQQLADYLSVDRSAMSAELGKMQNDGLIEVKKNHFHLNAKPEELEY